MRMPDSLSFSPAQMWAFLKAYPWRDTVLRLRSDFLQARLSVSASSLTFTTVLALVPLFTVILSLLTAFPVFDTMQNQLQRVLVESLVPESISRQVLGNISQFAKKASRLGSVGVLVLLLTSVALLTTIERSFNQIWGVQNARPWSRRLVMYWTTLTLVPLVLAVVLLLGSWALAAVKGMPLWWVGTVNLALDLLELLLLSACMACMYRYVPHAQVAWRHAIASGVLVAILLELAKKGLAVFLTTVPTYSVVYGAFAAVPILLIWIYTAWLLMLLGADLAASWPDVGRPLLQKDERAGQALRQALQTLALLHRARQQGQAGLSVEALAQALQWPQDAVHAALKTLAQRDWVGALQETDPAQRHVLLVDPDNTPLAPLLQQLMLADDPATASLWQALQADRLMLGDVLPKPAVDADDAVGRPASP